MLEHAPAGYWEGVDAPDLATALEALRAAVARLRLGLATPGAAEARQAQAELVGQVDDYLLPRLRSLEAPLLAVVGGSTGAGKSTLVNTLVGATVSSAGWLRPTTRGPVLVCNPADRGWFTSDRVLPDLARSTGDAGAGSTGTLHVVAHPGVPAGLALLDAPDVDSVVAENRRLASQLLAAADLWIFCTSAARYADAVPWGFLHTAQQRSTALAVVLNRVPPEGTREISRHLAQMLDDNGLGRAALFTVPETVLDGEGARLPESSVAPLRAWLATLADDADARAEVIRTTLDGALASLRRRVSLIAREADDQLAAAARLRDEAATAYDDGLREVDDGVRSGSLLRGEVLARWQEFVGTGELTRSLEERIGRMRDRVTAFVLNRPPPTAPVQEALESSLETLVRAAADGAAERAVESWRVRPAGRTLLGEHARSLAHASDGFRPALEREVRAWQGRVLELVASEGRERRTAARVASFGTNGAGLALMLAVMANTGGLTGAEILVGGRHDRRQPEGARGGLRRQRGARPRLDRPCGPHRPRRGAAEPERARFDALVAAEAPDAAAVASLRAALDGFEAARREARSLAPGAVR